jgi:DNA-binding XRE family transcriptional regulator
MPRRLGPRIVSVSAEGKPLTLRLAWADGTDGSVDLSAFLETFEVFEPLRRRPDLFREVQRGEHGTDVFWSEELDLAADTLWRLSREQAAAVMSPAALRDWRARKAYSFDTAAKALGINRRMLIHYEYGAKPFPRAVFLATQALESGYA